MSLEGWSIRALQEELQLTLTDSKVDRVFQHSSTELSLEIHKTKTPLRLLFSIHPQFARVHLITQKRKNPPVPPSFCQLLRRRLEGARFISVEQPDLERMLIFRFSVYDELGNPDEIHLIAELMGKNSNLILCDREFLILDAIKHVPSWQNRFREILPGRQYQRPPLQTKQDFFAWNPPTKDKDLSISVSDWLKKNIDGIGVPTVQALLREVGIEEEQMSAFLSEEQWTLLQHRMQVTYENRKAGCLYQTELSQTLLPFAFSTGSWSPASSALEEHFKQIEQHATLLQERNRLSSILQAAWTKGRKKLFALEEDLQQGKDADCYRIWGELLKNAPEPEVREEEIQVINYYDENLDTISIPLDIRLNIAQNAQNYFKRYSKARKGEKIILEQIEMIRAEVIYLESVLMSIQQTEELSILSEIQEELIQQGFISAPKATHKSTKKKTKQPSKVLHEPLRLTIDGVQVSIGRNNLQNDDLTMELSRNSDWWFHSKEVPGSHVVVHTAEPSDSMFELAAALAAWFSQARSSSYVGIDYTKRKNVKKFKGAKPGSVHYTDFYTLYVAPRSPDDILLLNKGNHSQQGEL